MNKRIPVYEQQIALGDLTVTVLSTTAPGHWSYDYYESEEPIGYLELLEEQL